MGASAFWTTVTAPGTSARGDVLRYSLAGSSFRLRGPDVLRGAAVVHAGMVWDVPQP